MINVEYQYHLRTPVANALVKKDINEAARHLYVQFFAPWVASQPEQGLHHPTAEVSEHFYGRPDAIKC